MLDDDSLRLAGSLAAERARRLAGPGSVVAVEYAGADHLVVHIDGENEAVASELGELAQDLALRIDVRPGAAEG